MRPFEPRRVCELVTLLGRCYLAVKQLRTPKLHIAYVTVVTHFTMVPY
jgi:hypothetical protein